MKEDYSELKKIIEKKLVDDDIIVDSIIMEEENNYLFLKITLDKVGGLDLDAIVLATKKINPIVDAYEINEEDYILDISSKERKTN